MASLVKRVLVGKPIASAEEHHHRLIKFVALAIFASDAISSTSYASEEILHVLMPLGGLEALESLVPIALIVMVLLGIVVTSYRQTVKAYPQGGGTYVVSRENLGRNPSLVAGASILVDYILTVAVSVSAGVSAIIAANPDWADHRISLCLFCVAIMMIGNLRGLKESGAIFAGPTYIYIGALSTLILYGLYRSFFGNLEPILANPEAMDHLTDHGRLMTGITAFALLRAFSSGAIALSGIEAIADGVPAFKPPESKNAGMTLAIMGGILATFFFGISVLAHRLKPTLIENQTLLSIMGGHVFGRGTILYLVLQISTFAILILAANTAFADFPRLSSIIARDGFLPRQLANRGDRLVFSNGIILLSVAAGLLVIGFGGQPTKLIHLYAVGVFTGFTLSQAGMVRYHRTHRGKGWQRNMVVNGIGSAATGLVLVIVLVSKFTVGAWMPAVVIPAIVFLFRGIRKHYDGVSSALDVPDNWRPVRYTHTVVVLVGNVHRGVLAALTYAKSLAPDRLVAVSVVADESEEARLQDQWEKFKISVPLQMQQTPYRDLAGPVLRYLDELDAQHENDIITVILPEFVLTKWWEQLLHNQSALMLKARLLFRRNTVVVSIPYHIDGKRIELPVPDGSSSAVVEPHRTMDDQGDGRGRDRRRNDNGPTTASSTATTERAGRTKH